MYLLRVILGCFAAAALAAGHVGAQHYYSGGKAIPLKIDSSRVPIRFDAGFSSMEQVMLLPSVEGMAQ